MRHIAVLDAVIVEMLFHVDNDFEVQEDKKQAGNLQTRLIKLSHEHYFLGKFAVFGKLVFVCFDDFDNSLFACKVFVFAFEAGKKNLGKRL